MRTHNIFAGADCRGASFKDEFVPLRFAPALRPDASMTPSRFARVVIAERHRGSRSVGVRRQVDTKLTISLVAFGRIRPVTHYPPKDQAENACVQLYFAGFFCTGHSRT